MKTVGNSYQRYASHAPIVNFLNFLEVISYTLLIAHQLFCNNMATKCGPRQLSSVAVNVHIYLTYTITVHQPAVSYHILLII